MTIFSFDYKALDPIKVKGKSDFIPVFQPVGEKHRSQNVLWDRVKARVKPKKVLIGRDAQINVINSVFNIGSGIIVLEAEIGMSKSMLLHHVEHISSKEGVRYLKGNANSLQTAELHVWKSIFFQLFGLHKIRKKPDEQKQEAVVACLTEWCSEWLTYSKTNLMYQSN